MSDMKLREFLNEGAIVRTKLSDCTKWVTNLVQNINDDCIEIDIGLEKDYIDHIVMTGDTMRCKFTTGNVEYSLTGWITRIKLEPPQTITIRIHQIDSFENCRESYRFDVYLSAIIKGCSGDGKGVFAVMTNISGMGAAFIVKDPLEEHLGLERFESGKAEIDIEVYITSEKQFCSRALLLRKTPREKGIEYGICFEGMESKSQQILNDFLLELANKDKEIYNKRSGFWSKNSKGL